VSDEFAAAEGSLSSPEEYDDLIEDEVRKSLHTTRCSKLLARHVYPNLPQFRFIPKSCRRLSELRTLLRQTENLTKLNHRCDGLIIQRLHGTVITGRDATILKWKDRDKITIDVKIADDCTPLALVGDGTTSHIECSNHVRVGLSGNHVQFEWNQNEKLADVLEIGTVVECCVQLVNDEPSENGAMGVDQRSNRETTKCILLPVRVREKSVANTVYVISRTLENVVEGLTLDDVCKLLGLSERGIIAIPEIEVEPVENEQQQEQPMDLDSASQHQVDPISPGRVSETPTTTFVSPQEFYRPGSPLISRSHQMSQVSFDSTQFSHSSQPSHTFFRPGSPIISERESSQVIAVASGRINAYEKNFPTSVPKRRSTVEDGDVSGMEIIVLPQEVPEVHSMENDPMFTVVD
jgi:hypothetical protein